MEPLIGTIMPVAFKIVPQGWASCDGQLLQISQNQALFSLLGTNFGGDGRTTFALPDLRGRAVCGSTSTRPGTMSGLESVALNPAQIPAHTHTVGATTAPAYTPPPPAGKFSATDKVLSTSQSNNTLYDAPDAPVTLGIANTSSAGGSQAHDNMQPALIVNYIIALTGIYPMRP